MIFDECYGILMLEHLLNEFFDTCVWWTMKAFLMCTLDSLRLDLSSLALPNLIVACPFSKPLCILHRHGLAHCSRHDDLGFLDCRMYSTKGKLLEHNLEPEVRDALQTLKQQLRTGNS